MKFNLRVNNICVMNMCSGVSLFYLRPKVISYRGIDQPLSCWVGLNTLGLVLLTGDMTPRPSIVGDPIIIVIFNVACCKRTNESMDNNRIYRSAL